MRVISYDTFMKKCAKCKYLEVAIIEDNCVKVMCRRLRCKEIDENCFRCYPDQA